MSDETIFLVLYEESRSAVAFHKVGFLSLIAWQTKDMLKCLIRWQESEQIVSFLTPAMCGSAMF